MKGAVTGENHPIKSKTSPTLPAQFVRVKVSGKTFAETSGFLPLRFFAKLRSGILNDNRSSLEYHFEPATEMDLPSLVRCGGGSKPEKVKPLKLNPALPVTRPFYPYLVGSILYVFVKF